jgi:hypothetical protein
MKALTIAVCAAAFALLMGGCEVADPIVIAVGLPLEVSADLNGGNSWSQSDTFTLEDEIKGVDVTYADDVIASRVNDITIYMVKPPASGTSSGTLSYSSPDIGGGAVYQLATWSNVPISALVEPGVSVLNASVLTINEAAREQLLGALQDTSGFPIAASFTVTTSGTTSVDVPAGTKIVAKFHYQFDVEI